MISNRQRISELMQSGRINPQFQTRIMLAVTAVNGCVYCEWAHTRSALEHGCSEDEIDAIMTNDFGSCDPDEVVGLAFAQHYAETRGNPSQEFLDKLVLAYGLQKAQDILLIIQMITIGNLLGNTLDAFNSRMKGKPPQKGSFFFELVVFLLAFPLAKKFENFESRTKFNS